MKALRTALPVFAAFGAAPAAADDFDGERVSAVVNAADFDGDVAVAIGLEGSPRYKFVGALPEAYRGGNDGLTWRWASVTKQIVAIMVMQQVEKGMIDLDAPVATYLPNFASENAGTATIRHLLQHRAGLPNPENSDDGSGNRYAFYADDYRGSRDPVTGFCAGPALGEPGGEWSYNNCDYIVLGAVLEAVTGLAWQELFDRDIATPLELRFAGAYPSEDYTRWGFLGEEREPERDLSVYGASAGLFGSIEDLIAINRGLLSGTLLGEDALAEMWRGDPALGFMALGQWVFEAKLKGCDAPIKIVERRGDIGAVQVRNFILPELNMSVVAFSQQKPFEFGEIWMGSGFSYDLLSSAACPK